MKFTSRKQCIDFLSSVFHEEEHLFSKNDWDDVDISRNDVWTDLLLHALEFVYNEGFSRQQVVHFLKFLHGLIKDTACQDLPKDDAVCIFRERICEKSLLTLLPTSAIKSIIDYVCSELFQHYHVISYVMCVPRDVDEHAQKQIVEVPSLSKLTLQESVAYDKWLIDTKLKQAEENYLEKQKAIDKHVSESEKRLQEELVASLQQLEAVPSKNELKDVLSSIVRKYADLTELEIEASLMRSKEHVLHAFEKSKIEPPSSSKIKRSARSPNKLKSSVSPKKK